MNSKLQLREKLGHVVQIHVCRLPFAVNAMLNLETWNVTVAFYSLRASRDKIKHLKPSSIRSNPRVPKRLINILEHR